MIRLSVQSKWNLQHDDCPLQLVVEKCKSATCPLIIASAQHIQIITSAILSVMFVCLWCHTSPVRPDWELEFGNDYYTCSGDSACGMLVAGVYGICKVSRSHIHTAKTVALQPCRYWSSCSIWSCGCSEVCLMRHWLLDTHWLASLLTEPLLDTTLLRQQKPSICRQFFMKCSYIFMRGILWSRMRLIEAFPEARITKK